ncbi:MAG: hypothetical protein QM769_14935 [Pseudoxanthomonas sp.]
MSLHEINQGSISNSDFTLLEGLYQLAIAGHAQDWEFDRLNQAVYDRLLTSYADAATELEASIRNNASKVA